MTKRAALARALALDPAILFLDEPTSGLDPISAAAFDELVLDLQRGLGLTVVMITHDLDTIYRVCNRVGVIVDGRMIAGTLEEIVRERPSLDPGLLPRRAQPRARERGEEQWIGKRTTSRSGPSCCSCWSWRGLRALVLRLGRRRGAMQRYEIYFDGSVSGLSEGSTVRYLGVVVGRVRASASTRATRAACASSPTSARMRR